LDLAVAGRDTSLATVAYRCSDRVNVGDSDVDDTVADKNLRWRHVDDPVANTSCVGSTKYAVSN